MPEQAQHIPVNPALLRWARDTAGLSLPEAARRAKITPLKARKDEPARTPEERLAAWEAGEAPPTLAQLEALAKAYYRPLVTFFLSTPPERVEPLADFRTVQHTPAETPEFAALKRRVFQLHRTLRAIAEDEQADALPFVGSCSMPGGVSATVDALRRTLGIEPVAEGRCSPDGAFRTLRDKAQTAGVYVVLMGNVGNYRSRVEPEEFRGIAMADPLAPLVVINNYDVEVARLFTLAHELAHIFLGSTGVSNQHLLAAQGAHARVEQFCNAVAAELLVPERLLRPAWSKQHGEPKDNVSNIASAFGVSEEVIARRLRDIGLLDADNYGQLVALYRARWQRNKERKSQSQGGPNQDIVTRYRLGTKTLKTLQRAADNGLITFLDAARTLNMTVSRFERVAG